jgi:nucleoside-diphosphate-sugar epimerase
MQAQVESERDALITGATGLLGGEIAARLVEFGWNVRAIVRATDDREASRRLRSRLGESGKTSLMETGRLVALAGDVTAEGLGLSADFQLDVPVLVHCAGETSFKEAGRCWRTNVGAAERLIEFVRRRSSRPKVYFISTASVCLSPVHSEVSEDAAFEGFENGYTASKRQAERLLLESGLDPVIIRPSIVLSRGVRSRRMARSILWVIPVMRSLGEVPIDPQAKVDLVPVDYTADVIGRLVNKGALCYRNYHVSAGPSAAPTCSEIIETVSAVNPSYRRIRLAGPGRPHPGRRKSERALMTALDYYAPFLNANVVYSNLRVREELGPETPHCPKATEYVNELMRKFSPQEAVAESIKP